MQCQRVQRVPLEHNLIIMLCPLHIFILNAAERHEVVRIQKIRVVVKGFFQLDDCQVIAALFQVIDSLIIHSYGVIAFFHFPPVFLQEVNISGGGIIFIRDRRADDPMLERVRNMSCFGQYQAQKVPRGNVIFIKKKALLQICSCAGKITACRFLQGFIVKPYGNVPRLMENIGVSPAAGTDIAFGNFIATVKTFHDIAPLAHSKDGGCVLLFAMCCKISSRSCIWEGCRASSISFSSKIGW